jgi:hypothetical protein
MSLDSLALRAARIYVRNYSSEYDELTASHREAMDCRDCEAFLQLGIDAFKWLGRADAQYRMCMFKGLTEHDPVFEEHLALLYKLWLRPGPFANQWIQTQLQREYRPDNLEAFQECVEEVRAIVKPNDEVSGEIAILRDGAIEDFRAGRTSAWEA